MTTLTRLGYIILSLLIASCGHMEEPAKASYVEALTQLNAGVLKEAGLSGHGVKIGIIDLGFSGLNENPATRNLFERARIVFAKQYYPDSLPVFFSPGETHGFAVTFMMGGQSKRDTCFGGALAVDADYYLAKIGKSTFENKTFGDEENNVRIALEDLYQRGVRLVNFSLGYWDEFENDEENYSPAMMDGKTTRIAKICREFAAKGMIIVTAAGNTGEYAWRIVWTPADVEEVITVGACNRLSVPHRVSYSSIGNPLVDFVKPDVVCYSTWGTSLSTPVITSLIALMLETDSTLTPLQVKRILQKASNLYPYPNNYVGYGIPDAALILELLDDPGLEPNRVKVIHTEAEQLVIETTSPSNLLFQKSGPYVVKRQYLLEPEDGKITLRRKRNIPRSTLVTGPQVYEIFWK
ncbi:MAG TPA: S8 family serine peptidase [Bacteroidales bacterium]|nr:S8 family serine peptidase [Bacteroidales bacterium]HSA42476.1 S8 family serine peptidase [Bacteroidales bacterium]